MDYFKQRYTVIWADYRGHHLSEMPKKTEALTVENMGRDLVCLLDELGIKKTAVLGHSMGVNVVLELFRTAPDRIASIVLANGSARSPLESLFRTNIMQTIVPKIYALYKRAPKLLNFIWSLQGKTRWTSAVVGMLGFNPHLARKEDIETYVRMVTEMDMIVTLQLLSDYERYDATAWLDRINVPTLIIAGENDIIIPREAQEVLHQLIPESRYFLVRNGSHCPQMDIPDLINLTIDRFLERFTLRLLRSHHRPNSRAKENFQNLEMRAEVFDLLQIESTRLGTIYLYRYPMKNQ